eukprot:1950566-Pyramimonas_sp.AAC.1
MHLKDGSGLCYTCCKDEVSADAESPPRRQEGYRAEFGVAGKSGWTATAGWAVSLNGAIPNVTRRCVWCELPPVYTLGGARTAVIGMAYALVPFQSAHWRSDSADPN